METSNPKTPQNGGDKAENSRTARMRAHLPPGLIFARYLWPPLTALTLFVMGWFYNISAARDGQGYLLSLIRLYANTLSGTHAYLGGAAVAEKTRLYALLSVGAVVGILLFLLGLFFAGLAAYTALRAFLAKDAAAANRYKLIFKIAFPNRVCLFLSNALLVLPTLYPHYYSAVSGHFLSVSKEAAVYLIFNPPLLVIGAMTAVTLLLALLIPRFERAKNMDMFCIRREDEKRDTPPEV